MRDEYKANAVVAIDVVVDNLSVWGTDCTVAQVHDQAGRESMLTVRNLLEKAHGIRVLEVRVKSVSAIVRKANDDA